jgi:hypothetical protein
VVEPVPGGVVAVCTEGGWTTILVPVDALTRLRGLDGDFAEKLAQLLAHELAHIPLHHHVAGAARPLAQRELEADELGAYWYARAGYACDAWIDRAWLTRTAGGPDAQRAAVARGCARARSGAGPPLLE